MTDLQQRDAHLQNILQQKESDLLRLLQCLNHLKTYVLRISYSMSGCMLYLRYFKLVSHWQTFVISNAVTVEPK